MFNSFVAENRRKKPARWKTITALVSVLAHAVVITGLIVHAYWKIDKLEAKYVPVVTWSVQPPAPVPTAPPKLGSPTPTKMSGAKHAAKLLTDLQPIDKLHASSPKEVAAIESAGTRDAEGGPEGLGDPNGHAQGCDGCIGLTPHGLPGVDPTVREKVDCRVTGDCPKKKVEQVPPKLAEGFRVTGNPKIAMPDATKAELAAKGLTSASVTVNLCLSDEGTPTSVTFNQRSGYADLDDKIAAEMQTWRYRAYVLGGEAVPFCTVVTFQYRISPQ